ncbi:MAG TPA: PKD domain-containing protein [Thermoanaerobaculia bacterium]
MKQSRWLQCLVLTLLVAVSSFADDGLVKDAESYAAQFGVSVDEGVRRLQLQPAVSELEGALLAEESAAFAGLWIQHEPDYRIVVRFTNRAAAARLKARVAGGPLEKLVETRGARWSLAELGKQQQEVRAHAEQLDMRLESDINVFDNKVEVYTTEPEKLSAKLAAAKTRLPESAGVKRVKQHSVADELIGGVLMGNCSSAFGVRHAFSGELGVLTAGHCADTQYYQGVALPLRNQRVNEHYDVQWNSTCDLVHVSNRFDSGTGIRSASGVVYRDNQTIGALVCKNGGGNGYRCGTIQSKNFDLGPGFHSTFIRVNGLDLRAPGDSGAPWFVGTLAYGIHQGAPADDPNDAIYMAINYAGILNVQVLTYDPGPNCNLLPFADFFSSGYGSYYEFDAETSFDPDGTIVSYTWDFGDGTPPYTTTEPFTTHQFPYGTWIMTMTVTDNEGGTDTMTEIKESCRYFACP